MTDWLIKTKINRYISIGVFAALGVVGVILCMGALICSMLYNAWLLLLLIPAGVITGVCWALVVYVYSIIEEED